MNRSLRILATLLLLPAACRGSRGSAGPFGPPGPRGPVTPSGNPPLILSIDPAVASTASRLRIVAAYLSTSGTEVLVDGTPATILRSAPVGTVGTAQEMWVSGIPQSSETAGYAEVVVRTASRDSAAVSLPVHASGSVEALIPPAITSIFGLALDSDGSSVLVFDRNRGIFRRDSTTGILSRLPTDAAIDGVTVGARDGATLVVADVLGRVLRIDGGVVHPVATLPGSTQATAMAVVAGVIYFSQGGTTVGRIATDGTVTANFGTFVSASAQIYGLAAIGNTLYAADRNSGGRMHSIALPGGGAATEDIATGLGTPGALTTDATSLYMCIADSGGTSVRKITAGGVVTSYAPARPATAGASNGCAMAAGGLIFSTNDTRQLVESFTPATGWRAKTFGPTPGGPATWAGIRFFPADLTGCPVSRGAVEEVFADGSSRVVDDDACPAYGIGRDDDLAPTEIAWAETGRVRALDLATGATSTAVTDAALTTPTGVAIAPDGSFYVANGSPLALTRYSAAGAAIACSACAAVDETPRAIARSGSELYVGMNTKLVRFDVAADGSISNATTVSGTATGFGPFARLAAADDDGVLFAESTATPFVYRVDAAGSILLTTASLAPQAPPGETPWGDLFRFDNSGFAVVLP